MWTYSVFKFLLLFTVSIGFTLSACGLIPKPTYFPKPGEQRTFSYLEAAKEETVYDLRGQWFLRNDFGRFKATGTQNKNNISFTLLESDRTRDAGEILFRGHIKGDLIEGEYFVCPSGRTPGGSMFCSWILAYGRINKGATKVEVNRATRGSGYQGNVTITFERVDN